MHVPLHALLHELEHFSPQPEAQDVVHPPEHLLEHPEQEPLLPPLPELLPSQDPAQEFLHPPEQSLQEFPDASGASGPQEITEGINKTPKIGRVLETVLAKNSLRDKNSFIFIFILC